MGSYNDLDVCDEYETEFFSMCGCIHTISDENAGDTHTLNYTNP